MTSEPRADPSTKTMDTKYAIEYGPRSDTRDTMTSRPGAARSGEEIVPLQRMARVLSERDERSELLAKAIAGLTPLQRDLYGTRQRSLLDIPPKPDTEAWYARRADERRERKAAKKAENQRRAEAGKHPSVKVSDPANKTL